MWKKPIINMILILLIIAVVVYGTIAIVKYFETRDFTVIEKQGDIKSLDISKLEGVYIEKTNRISSRYILIKATNSVKEDETSEKSTYVNNLYLFDIDSKSFLDNSCTYENVNLDYIGSDESNMYLMKKEAGSITSVLVIKYPELEKVKEISLTGIKNMRSEICVSNDGSQFAYTTDNGLYVTDNNFKNTKMILKVDKTKTAKDAENYVPVQFIDNDNLIYKKIGYEWSCGIGKISLKTKETSFYEGNIELLKYDVDSIYVKDSIMTLPIQKYNLNTQEATVLISQESDEYIRSLEMNTQNDKIVYDIEKNENGKVGAIYNIYSIENNKNVAEITMQADNIFASTLGLYFVDDGNSVLIIDTNAIKVWKY